MRSILETEIDQEKMLVTTIAIVEAAEDAEHMEDERT